MHTLTINRKRLVAFRPNATQCSPTPVGPFFYSRVKVFHRKSNRPSNPGNFHSESSGRPELSGTPCARRGRRVYYCACSTGQQSSSHRNGSNYTVRYASDRVKPCPSAPPLNRRRRRRLSLGPLPPAPDNLPFCSPPPVPSVHSRSLVRRLMVSRRRPSYGTPIIIATV